MSTPYRIGLVALIGAAAMSSINAQVTSPTSPRSSNAEFRMLGITLYQTGKQVIAKYGTPIEILALGSGGGGAAGPAGGTNNPGAGGAPGGRPGGGGGGGGGSSLTPLIYRPGDIIGDPFDTGETAFRQFNPDDAGSGPQGPKSSGNGNAGPSGAGGGGGGGATGTEGNIIFTRWVYKRGTSQYAFLFDKANRVVQIEAIGLKDGNVKTRNGTTFGATFGQLIKMYGAPDGYEINGQTIVVKYLVQRRVAFRLTRLVPNQLHKVTGIVIAAGKG